MSYQVLARKYRPRDFASLVGQEHIVRALSHALDAQRLHHAYLFSGTRGVGKTTLSRILAKAFNCIGVDGNGGITSTPCGVCAHCVGIEKGGFLDYIEMDAASNRGVGEMVELLEKAVYSPAQGRIKVYMIDEVHMLTSQAFNAMLKTLEEPPPYVKFILATTDPQKILPTVLSRCLQFNLKQMPPDLIAQHLSTVLAAETIECETGALHLLARAAHGSMRDALSLSDQAIVYAAGPITTALVAQMLGVLDQTYLIRLLNAVIAREGATLYAIAQEMASRSLSFHAALNDLANLLQQLAMAQITPEVFNSEEVDYAEKMHLAQQFSGEELQLYYQIVTYGARDLALAPDELAGFSMTLLRLLHFSPVTDAQQISAHSAAHSATARDEKKKPEPDALTPAATPAPRPDAVTPKLPQARMPATATQSPPQHTASVKTQDEPPAVSADEASATDTSAPKADVLVTRDTTGDPRSAVPNQRFTPDSWREWVLTLGFRGGLAEVAYNSEWLDQSESSLTLKIPSLSLLTADNEQQLSQAIAAYLGVPLQLKCVEGSVQKTARQQQRAQQDASRRALHQAVLDDPLFIQLQTQFGASLIPDSIRPPADERVQDH